MLPTIGEIPEAEVYLKLINKWLYMDTIDQNTPERSETELKLPLFNMYEFMKPIGWEYTADYNRKPRSRSQLMLLHMYVLM